MQMALEKADGIFEVLLGERPNLHFHITMLRARIKLKAGEVRSLLALLVQKYKYCCWAGELASSFIVRWRERAHQGQGGGGPLLCTTVAGAYYCCRRIPQYIRRACYCMLLVRVR
jgi:hypothetical protein